jgi:hypothetical protein
MIDIGKAIEELRRRKELVESAISQIEQLLHAGASEPPKPRQGRKSMGEEERKEVSVRMKAYWENRRKHAAEDGAAPPKQ